MLCWFYMGETHVYAVVVNTQNKVVEMLYVNLLDSTDQHTVS